MDAALEDKGIPREAINSMKGMLADMYVNSLPENHALSSEAKRHYVAGAEPDMLRSFASTIERNAFFMSRLKYNPEVTKELFDLTNQANTQTATEQNVANEVLKRHNLDMQYVHQPYQNFIAKMSGIYHLFSPFVLDGERNPTVVYRCALPRCAVRPRTDYGRASHWHGGCVDHG